MLRCLPCCGPWRRCDGHGFRCVMVMPPAQEEWAVAPAVRGSAVEAILRLPALRSHRGLGTRLLATRRSAGRGIQRTHLRASFSRSS